MPLLLSVARAYVTFHPEDWKEIGMKPEELALEYARLAGDKVAVSFGDEIVFAVDPLDHMNRVQFQQTRARRQHFEKGENDRRRFPRPDIAPPAPHPAPQLAVA